MPSYLESLIDRIVTPDETGVTSSRDSTSWQALREAEKLDDVKLAPSLEKNISGENDEKRRAAAYFILGHVAKNVAGSPEAGHATVFLIQRVSKETEKHLLKSLLDQIADLPKPDDCDLTPLFKATQSKSWLVRHSAIRALNASSHPETEKVLISILENAKDKDDKLDIIAANVVLAELGTAKALPLLREKSKSRIRDVKDTATEAVKAIELRLKNGDRN